MLEIAAGAYRLGLDPGRGGSIACFEWRGEPVMRATCGPSVIDTACFPLVPFSNRIAFGRFRSGGRLVALKPNFPGQDQPHPLHGFGWIRAWEIAEQGYHYAVLRHHYRPADWPWEYVSEQRFVLSSDCLMHSISVRNLSEDPMPAGLGFHPYFPRDEATVYTGLHRGEWRTSADGLPLSLEQRRDPVDWWQGKPARSRVVDTVYTGRQGALSITWPNRGLEFAIEPSANLTCTAVYTPREADFSASSRRRTQRMPSIGTPAANWSCSRKIKSSRPRYVIGRCRAKLSDTRGPGTVRA